MEKRPHAAAHTPHVVSRCLLCGHPAIHAIVNDRFVTTNCPACRATLVIEFNPPDEPEIRARIERVDTSSDPLARSAPREPE
jgi:hypothetical protein